MILSVVGPGENALAPMKVTSRLFRSEAAEHYNEADLSMALAKGAGRVTLESLQQGRPPRNWFEMARENSRSKERRYGALDGKNSTEPQKSTQKHVFWGLTKNTEKHFYHLGYRG